MSELVSGTLGERGREEKSQKVKVKAKFTVKGRLKFLIELSWA